MSKGNKKQSRLSERLNKELPFHLMLLPGVLLVLVFKYIPMVGLSIAFQDYSPLFGIFEQDWCGLENFRYIFTYARAAGIPFTIHSGEAVGVESMRHAIDFGTRRIGHGVRSYNDEKMKALLKAKDVCLTFVPQAFTFKKMFVSHVRGN